MPLLPPDLVFRPLDQNGHVMPGAKLYAYLAGTTTPHSLYAEDGSLLGTSVTLDSTGATKFRLDSSPYKLNLLDANNVQAPLWPVDNVTAGGGGTVLVVSTTITLGPGTDNQPQLLATNLMPANVDVVVVTTYIAGSFGISRGLNQIAIGDPTTIDRWGVQTNLSVGAVSGGTNKDANCTPPLTDLVRYPAPQSVILTALGGAFDTAGQIQVAVQYLDLTHRMS